MKHTHCPEVNLKAPLLILTEIMNHEIQYQTNKGISCCPCLMIFWVCSKAEFIIKLSLDDFWLPYTMF